MAVTAALSLGTRERTVNPFLPSYEMVPDGEPRVFGDRVYLYGSHDLNGGSDFCEGDYVCYSAALDDLSAWRYDGVIYERRQDPFIAAQLARGKQGMTTTRLFAPDVIELDGRYFMYYGVGLSKSGFGVAVSDSPTGPFEYVGRVRLPEEAKPAGWVDGADGIVDGDLAFGEGRGPISRGRLRFADYPYDPAVLLHEGRLFLYFGLLNCSVIELDRTDNRTVVPDRATGEYVTPVIRQSLARAVRARSAAAHGATAFMNGPSIREVDGRFVLSYWAMGGAGFSGMYHAVADAPRGPFVPAGPLVALGNAWKQPKPTYPGGNTHGGMFEADGRWYQVFHRHTADGRQACVAPLTRRGDGAFEQADSSSLGFSDEPLDAFALWPAYIACHLTAPRKRNRPAMRLRDHELGDIDPGTGRRTLQVLANTRSGAVAGFEVLDFGEDDPAAALSVDIDPEGEGAIEVRLDTPNGRLISTVVVPASTVGRGWTRLHAPVVGVSGVHPVFLVFRPRRGRLGDVAAFGFRALAGHGRRAVAG
ncbi:family 43 glycosylhydrolase [Agromyces sp. MMS24-JH15]|uniref:family 43 glycosylhydrolase n=1 Tax=Agromyces sp. MMS24-JH15 TaxID=3243765 RepID=UPI0037497E7B